MHPDCVCSHCACSGRTAEVPGTLQGTQSSLTRGVYVAKATVRVWPIRSDLLVAVHISGR